MGFQRLSILGFGLLGGSLAQAVQRSIFDCDITAYDIDPESIKAHRCPRLDIAATVAEAVSAADCIVIAVPPEQAHMLLREMASAIPEDAVVTDVASVKRAIVRTAGETLRHPSRFVGGHPMAGGERTGSAFARADLFDGAAVVLTPTEITDPSAVEAVQVFWEKLGGRVYRMSPEDHDSAVANVSHFPHVLASAIMHSVPPHAEHVVGPGFRDMTRIAAGDPELWRQILRSNSDQVRLALQSMQQQLQKFDRLLEQDQQADLRRWLAAAAVERRKLDATTQ